MSAFLTILIAITGGYLLTYLLDRRSHFLHRLTKGFFLGITLWGLVGFGLASIVQSLPTWIPLVSSLLIFFIGYKFALSRSVVIKSDVLGVFTNLKKHVSSPTLCNVTILIYWVLIGIFFHLISSSAFFLKDGEYFTRYSDNYSDATLHSGIVAGFAYGDNFPPIHPDFSGTKLSYPFLVNFIAAMMVVLGLRIDQAFYLQYMMCFMLLTLLLQQWSFSLIKNRLASYLSPLIIYFSGGLGFLVFIKELMMEKDWWQFLLHLSHEYTNHTDLIRWGNALINWFVPMRSLLLGVPLALIVFGWWWRILQSKKEEKVLLFGAGFVAGLMPLAHTHSFLVVMGVTFIWSLIFKKIKKWMMFGIATFVFGLPQLLWIKLGSQADFGTFFGIMDGWVRADTNFFWFWLANTGAFIPLLMIVFIFPNLIERKLKLYFTPFLLLFFVGNFLRVTPWDWDNNKILLYWFIPSSILISYLIAIIWKSGSIQKFVAALVLFILTFSGGLDLFRVVIGINNWTVFDQQTIKMAEEIKKLPKKSVLVTAPYINNPILLSGRYTYMGYTGRLWTHGLLYGEREEKVQKAYEGDVSIIATEEIDYIILGEIEKNWMTERSTEVNQHFFDQLIPIARVADRTLFKVR